MSRVTMTTPPAAEPISLTEAKLHLRVDHTDDDLFITGLIRAARERAEFVTRRQLVLATYQLKLDEFSTYIELPRYPAVVISSIKYINAAGVLTTITATDYTLYTSTEPAWVEEAYGYSWPTPRAVSDCVQVNFIAGYAAKFTANAGTDFLTASGRTYTDADIIRVSTTEEDLPLPLAELTDYHVRDQAGYTFKLAAAAGGAVIDITDAGTGTHFVGVVPEGLQAAMKLLIGHWYEHREAYSEGRPLIEVPQAIESLLWQYRMLEADS